MGEVAAGGRPQQVGRERVVDAEPTGVHRGVDDGPLRLGALFVAADDFGRPGEGLGDSEVVVGERLGESGS